MKKWNSIIKIILFAGCLLLTSGCGKEESKDSDIPITAKEESRDSNDSIIAKEESKDSNDSITAKEDLRNSGSPFTVSKSEESDSVEMEQIAAICQDIYEKAAKTNTSGSLDTMRHIVARLGEQGYTAVDSKNQVNMTNAEQALAFYQATEKRKPAELTILVAYDSGLRKFDLKTEDGKVSVVREYGQYDENGILKSVDTASYPADLWKFTEEGYLIFEGNYFSAVNYVLTLSDLSEHTVLRVLPLDETCREWNRNYILPAGYGRNNIFLSDWSEGDFGALNLYDVFDVFYQEFYQRPAPYAANENLNEGAVYQVPEDEFESVISAHFNIDRERLRAKTSYVPEDGSYEYRPRGFYEADYSDIPYPEVVSYTENQDGTITLLVNAVYPDGKTSRLFSHKTVIRPLRDEDAKDSGKADSGQNDEGMANGGKWKEADGPEHSLPAEEGFWYVSNQVIFSSGAGGTEGEQKGSLSERDNCFWWHAERLTQEQWEKIYGGKNKGM